MKPKGIIRVQIIEYQYTENFFKNTISICFWFTAKDLSHKLADEFKNARTEILNQKIVKMPKQEYQALIEIYDQHWDNKDVQHKALLPLLNKYL
jgi:hypothetical protein